MPNRILGATEVFGRNQNVYCIGSFGRRVSFTAQQNRALNLAWALCKSGRVEAGNRIAVIGGGVTGLMMAAGLMSLGCVVDLYESGSSLVPRQRKTRHRCVHPTVNLWPDVFPSITTEFPFLDWHIGSCDLVVRDLIEQFASLKTPDSEIFKTTRVDEIVQPATNLITINTQKLVAAKAGRLLPLTYRAAVITIGFGDEFVDSNFSAQSYWYPDVLEHERDRADIYQRYIVSGCGDGGLLDALRIVHVDFDDGKLVFRSAAHLFDTPIADVIKKAEVRARDTPSSKDLEAAYSSAAEMLISDPTYSTVCQELDSSIASFDKLVYLTDRSWSPPFAPNTAPIHKLMIAHAKRRAKVIYEKGVVTEAGENIEINGRAFERKTTKVVARHGANPNPGLRRLLSKDELDSLKRRQEDLSEYLADKQWTDAFPALSGFPVPSTASASFIESRTLLAQGAAAIIDKTAKLARSPRSERGFRFTYANDLSAMAQPTLFGIPTQWVREPRIRGGRR